MNENQRKSIKINENQRKLPESSSRPPRMQESNVFKFFKGGADGALGSLTSVRHPSDTPPTPLRHPLTSISTSRILLPGPPRTLVADFAKKCCFGAVSVHWISRDPPGLPECRNPPPGLPECQNPMFVSFLKGQRMGR